MGRLQDFIFPAYAVRFIAINDDVDIAKGDNDFAGSKMYLTTITPKTQAKKSVRLLKCVGEAGNILPAIRLTDISKTRRIKING